MIVPRFTLGPGDGAGWHYSEVPGFPLQCPSSAEPYIGFTAERTGAPPRGERPKSAAYISRRGREVPPGSGGSPLPAAQARCRPVSARSAPKTERWRESGEKRWPEPATPRRPQEESQHQQPDPVPFRQTIEYHQGNWKNELWMRSLRQPGLYIQDPVYAGPPANLKDMHEEWRECPPFSPRSVPFCGATSSGPVAVKNDVIPDRWVERPVAHGKYALKHMDGSRYNFAGRPRFYDDPSSPHYVGPPPDKGPASSPSGTPKRPRSGLRKGITPSERWRAKLCQT